MGKIFQLFMVVQQWRNLTPSQCRIEIKAMCVLIPVIQLLYLREAFFPTMFIYFTIN